MIQANDETRLIRLHRKAIKKLELMLIACGDEIDSMQHHFEMDHPSAKRMQDRIRKAIAILEGKEPTS